jgi:hypothetical protein
MSRLLTCPWFGWITDEGAQFTEIIRAHDCQSPIEGPEDANEAESDQAVQKEFGLDVGCHIPSVYWEHEIRSFQIRVNLYSFIFRLYTFQIALTLICNV